MLFDNEEEGRASVSRLAALAVHPGAAAFCYSALVKFASASMLEAVSRRQTSALQMRASLVLARLGYFGRY